MSVPSRRNNSLSQRSVGTDVALVGGIVVFSVISLAMAWAILFSLVKLAIPLGIVGVLFYALVSRRD